ncbi:helix-turn-helix transcriptional regulator [Oceanobacillus jeddahense]|uniref:helix-turn-helix transcriptional regulator n=1 Tax=Oceanobacillus jeddahense TaxID=1462527 RepID=UPI000693E49A|nr:helix-turn-helix transcriptional regulator [Oceanobacillus jeddahense]
MMTPGKTVQDSILFIQQNLDKDLSLTVLADEAAYSPYHFSRMFKNQVGVSPMYFISSMRLQLAKKLLLDTAFPIRDIGLEVGQQSLGTFTTRFTNSIGMTPASFRASLQHPEEYMTTLKQDRQQNTRTNSASFQQLSGSIHTEEAFNGIIFAGLFPKPIPEGLPIRGTLLMQSTSFHITNIPVGTYFLMATAVTWETDSKKILLPHETLRARHPYPISIDGKRPLPEIHLIMRKPEITDPPILISLPLLMKHFLQRSPISH